MRAVGILFFACQRKFPEPQEPHIMPKTLTASEQVTLLRYASSLPEGSDMRKVLIAAAKVAAPQDTWGRRLNELKAEYMSEVVSAAIQAIKDEGGKAAGGAVGVVGSLKGTTASGEPIGLSFQWEDGWRTVESTMYLGREKKVGKHIVLSMAPANLAAESLYAHFQGLLP